MIIKSKIAAFFIGMLTIATSFGCISLKGDVTLVDIKTSSNNWCFNSSWDTYKSNGHTTGSAVIDLYVNSSIGYMYGQRYNNEIGTGQADGWIKHCKEWNCTVDNESGTINISYKYNAYVFLGGNISGSTHAKLWLTFFIDNEQHEVTLYNNTIENLNESDVFRENLTKNWSKNLTLTRKTYMIGVIANFEIQYTGNNTESIVYFSVYIPNTKPKETDRNVEYWALLIGVDCFWQDSLENMGVVHIPFYENVNEMYNMLLVSGHWQADHIKVLTKEEATLANIIEGFLWLDKMDDGDDISLVYYTAHGGNLHDIKIGEYTMTIDLPPVDEEDGYDEFLSTYWSDISVANTFSLTHCTNLMFS